MVLQAKTIFSTSLKKKNDHNLWIEDFIYYYENRFLKETEISKQKFCSKVVLPSSFSDAKTIAYIYNRVYRGSYPYKEMLDPKYVFESFKIKTFWWGLYQLNCDSYSKNEGKIIGCLAAELDLVQETVYFRGLMLLPEFQGMGLGRKACYDLIYHFLITHRNCFKKWYNENRTAHAISQKLSYCMGARPYALFNHKDSFFNRRESDVLMISYQKNFLNESRQPPPYLLSWMIPIYQQVSKFHDLQNVPKCTIEIKPNHHLMNFYENSIRFFQFQQKYNYTKIRIKNLINGDYIQGIITKSIDSLEKIKYVISDFESFITLFTILKNYVQKLQIKYYEIHIIVSDIISLKICQFLKNNNLTMMGYLPAFRKKQKSDLFYDVIIFTYINIPENQKFTPCLIPSAQSLYEIILD